MATEIKLDVTSSNARWTIQWTCIGSTGVAGTGGTVAWQPSGGESGGDGGAATTQVPQADHADDTVAEGDSEGNAERVQSGLAVPPFTVQYHW